ncbi:phosphotransferase [Ramlibacter pallidus]|uniref:Phosphotransferase n=1 Tax=Ramlibacter pallidus TaxID=2780087 RepID=A0ABR9S6X6_9BURK|nr:phosphotransferase [Ramlibacter pallidus]MBE7369251.1 phosphotransferase [Ramlibacter pallidus]
MNPQDVERIRASGGWKRFRTEAMETSEGPVVVKGQRRPRTVVAAWLLNLVARLARSPEMRPIPAPGGAQGQAIELRRLQELAAAGVQVPRVLHADAGFFVMERLPGQSLGERLAAQPADARALWEQGLRFLRDVHARGQYLSQASARNLIVTPEGIAAIDFEDDPREVLPLAAAQVRDWLLYLQSTVWLLPGSVDELLPLWARLAPAGADAAAMLESVERMAWMRHLPRKRKPWGRDIVSAQAAAALLHAWARRWQGL